MYDLYILLLNWLIQAFFGLFALCVYGVSYLFEMLPEDMLLPAMLAIGFLMKMLSDKKK